MIALFDLDTESRLSSTMVDDLNKSRRSRSQAIFPLNLDEASDLDLALITPPAEVPEAEAGPCSGT